MRKVLILPVVALVIASTQPTGAMAQLSTRVPVNGVMVHPVNHSAMVLEWNGHTVLVDPHDGAKRYAKFAAPGLILLTDIHGDHMDPATLQGLDLGKARIVAPQAVMDLLPEDLKMRCTPLANGARTELLGIGIEAVPMYNNVRGPEAGKLFHDKGRGNGYVLTFADKRVYLAGDTECTDEMKALQSIDVAFVCMNLPYTMPPAEAAQCVKAFKPKILYPYHYRDSDLAELTKGLDGEKSVEVRLRNWYP